MIWENTKLLLGLLYRPVSSMGRIVDEGHWFYAAVVVAALSMVFHATVTSVVYNNVEAVYRELPPEPVSASDPWEEDDGPVARPHFVYDRHPLPLVGDRGWWFVSFAPPGFFTTVLGMAVLYIPCLILLVAMSGVNASFSVLLRRDYGPLLTWHGRRLTCRLRSRDLRSNLWDSVRRLRSDSGQQARSVLDS
jgi:hypothetical protein